MRSSRLLHALRSVLIIFLFFYFAFFCYGISVDAVAATASFIAENDNRSALSATGSFGEDVVLCMSRSVGPFT